MGNCPTNEGSRPLVIIVLRVDILRGYLYLG